MVNHGQVHGVIHGLSSNNVEPTSGTMHDTRYTARGTVHGNLRYEARCYKIPGDTIYVTRRGARFGTRHGRRYLVRYKVRYLPILLIFLVRAMMSGRPTVAGS